MAERDSQLPVLRVTLVQYVLLACFLVLGYGFWRLQILSYDEYATEADHNRIRTEPIPAPRGRIFDREGRVIVDNYPSFNAYLVRDQTRTLDSDLAPIAQGLHLDLDDLRDRIAHFGDAPTYQLILIKDDITPQDLEFIEAHRDQFPELETLTVSRRLYPKSGFAAHLLGYVGEAGPREIQQLHLRPGSIVGKAGLEQFYNSTLTGQDGERRVMVDSRGRNVGELDATPPRAGQSIRLTIDNDLQIAAEAALGDRPGAIVALDPRTGEVLAMVSRPTFDPNQFTLRISPEQFKALNDDPEHPFLNKVIQAQLAPGSVFKLVMAATGLEAGIAQVQHTFCPGGTTFYGRYYKCWISARHQQHGMVDIHKAIVQSCDVFFYTLGNVLGIERISKFAKALGLGARTGIDLPHEATGLMPSEAWKLQHEHQRWYPGETISVAIGQGATTVTPLQLAHTVAGIVMGGQFYRPHVLLSVAAGEAEAGAPPADAAAFRQPTVLVQPANVGIITDAMRGVVGPEGTAASAHLDNLDFGGKTGTAQTISNQGLAELGKRHEFVDNAWFVGVYPLRNPQLVVCALYEHGAEGYFAGRLAAQVVEAYAMKHPDSNVPVKAHPNAASVARSTIGSPLARPVVDHPGSGQ